MSSLYVLSFGYAVCRNTNSHKNNMFASKEFWYILLFFSGKLFVALVTGQMSPWEPVSFSSINNFYPPEAGWWIRTTAIPVSPSYCPLLQFIGTWMAEGTES
jgi:hypothetical protein